MFRVVPPPIIRSANNCIYSIWYLSHRYYLGWAHLLGLRDMAEGALGIECLSLRGGSVNGTGWGASSLETLMDM
jgi:hypothetical protein